MGGKGSGRKTGSPTRRKRRIVKSKAEKETERQNRDEREAEERSEKAETKRKSAFELDEQIEKLWEEYQKNMHEALNNPGKELRTGKRPAVLDQDPPPLSRGMERKRNKQLNQVKKSVDSLIGDAMMEDFLQDSAEMEAAMEDEAADLDNIFTGKSESELKAEDIDQLFFESVRAEREYILTKMPTDEFITDYVYIESKDDPTDPIIKFEMWEGQKTALHEMEENRLNIVLKARQLGFTWLCLAYFVHMILRYPGFRVIALSETEEKSKELINRCDLILSQLPEWLIIPERKYKEFEKSNGRGTYKGLYYRKGVLKLEVMRAERDDEAHTSSIIVQPATEGAGRSLTADIVFFDEWAFHKWADEIFTAAYPTMARPTSGKFIGLSTNKRGTLYEDIWRHAEDRGFHKIFRNCFTDPRRDEEWYEKTAATMRGKMQQEFPRTEEEALSAGENVSFPEFSEEIHVCEPFEIPAHWRRWASVDNGYNDPFAWYKAAVSEDGTVYIYYEYSRWREEPKVIYSDQASIFANSMIYKNTFSNTLDFEKLDYIVAGKDAWNQHHRDSSGKNLIDYYREGGLTRVGFIPAVTDRKLRKAVLHEYLKPYIDENTGKLTAKLQIFSTCTYLISILPQLVNDDRDPEKVADLSDIDNCLTGDTIINTVTYGDIPIRELVGKTGTVKCFDEQLGEETVSEFYDVRCTNESAEVFEVELEDGTVIKATSYHPFLTTNGWKTVEELTEDDEIICI